MNRSILDRVAREASGRIVAALAGRFRDLDIAEDAFADACESAARAWPAHGVPYDPPGWLYRAAERRAIDALRRRGVRARLAPEPPPPAPTAEDALIDDARLIPDERLRLIFICCHPAVSVEARAALTLRLVCGLSVAEIARAFFVAEAALAQRLVRAKRKIADAGVPFEIPRPEDWPERLDAVLSTLEVVYAKAHEDAAGAGAHAGYATEILELTSVLAELAPGEADVLAFAALVRYAEARRPARVDDRGVMVPLSEQDPSLWRADLIVRANGYFERAAALGYVTSRGLEAAIDRAWCRRRSLAEPPPWRRVLAIYDDLLALRDDSVVRLNRAVAVAQVAGAQRGLEEVEAVDGQLLASYLPYHAVRAGLLRQAGRLADAEDAYRAALALDPAPAERAWLQGRRQIVSLQRLERDAH